MAQQWDILPYKQLQISLGVQRTEKPRITLLLLGCKWIFAHFFLIRSKQPPEWNHFKYYTDNVGKTFLQQGQSTEKYHLLWDTRGS